MWVLCSFLLVFGVDATFLQFRCNIIYTDNNAVRDTLIHAAFPTVWREWFWLRPWPWSAKANWLHGMLGSLRIPIALTHHRDILYNSCWIWVWNKLAWMWKTVGKKCCSWEGSGEMDRPQLSPQLVKKVLLREKFSWSLMWRLSIHVVCAAHRSLWK